MSGTAARTTVENLIAEYRRGGMARREFFQKLAYATGSLLVAHQIMLEEGFAYEWEAYCWPEQEGQAPPTPRESIAAGEKRKPANVDAEWVKYPSGDIEMGGYLAKPKSGAPFAGIIVVHENRGLTEFVLDMAQRWASEGLLALAPDCLSRLGGTQSFDSMQSAGGGIGKLQRDDVLADLKATLAYLRSRPDVKKDKVGITGFCWGGGQTFRMAVAAPDLAFAAPFYGPPPAVEELDKIQCPIHGTFAESDQRVNANLDAVEAKMKELGKTFHKRIFPGTQHAFMNFTGPRYNAEQAKAAWAEVTAFAKKVVD
jgi:carboxymethylenebutenolidase